MIGQESIMGTRSWAALAAIAVAVVAIFFALRETHSDPEAAPGRAASQDTVKPVPSNPDTVTPR
jgi:3-deoxy-D-manno-octulosonic acid (KDO) 8-phosphate synthase